MKRKPLKTISMGYALFLSLATFDTFAATGVQQPVIHTQLATNQTSNEPSVCENTANVAEHMARDRDAGITKKQYVKRIQTIEKSGKLSGREIDLFYSLLAFVYVDQKDKSPEYISRVVQTGCELTR